MPNEGRDAAADLAAVRAATRGKWMAKPSLETADNMVVLANLMQINGLMAWSPIALMFYEQEVDEMAEGQINHEADAKLMAMAKDALEHWIRRATTAEAELARLRGAR